MDKTLLALLICPRSGKNFELMNAVIDENDRVESGFLVTEDRMTYPIIRGVPRLIEGSLTLFKKDISHYTDALSTIDPSQESYHMSELFKKQYLPTLRQFEREWRSHSLEGKTWGWDQDKRINKYLEYMDIAPGNYETDHFLDLGAGTGQFTCTLASELNGLTVGVDLSPAIEAGEKIRKEQFPNARVNFIQSNLMALPFKKEAFEFVHASGVLHHTPDTKKAFDKVEKLVKIKGRLGVWLYRKTTTYIPLIPFINSRKTQISADGLRPYTSKMNPDILYGLIYFYSTCFHVIYKINEFVRSKKHEQSISERSTSLFDTLAPSYVHKHDEEEVRGWFKEAAYDNLVETDKDNVSGFNITGIKSA